MDVTVLGKLNSIQAEMDHEKNKQAQGLEQTQHVDDDNVEEEVHVDTHAYMAVEDNACTHEN